MFMARSNLGSDSQIPNLQASHTYSPSSDMLYWLDRLNPFHFDRPASTLKPVGEEEEEEEAGLEGGMVNATLR